MPLGVSVRRLTILWVTGTVATVLLLGGLTASALENGGWLGYWHLMQGGQVTEASIVSVQPHNHCRADYHFRVGGNQYQGSGPQCGVKVGDTIAVTFLVGDPRQSCLGLAKVNLQNELITITSGGLLIPPVIIFSYFARRQWKRDEGAA